ncbi:hypothetical protein TSUD_323290 [Trifolium subterraneum]|uniref:Uncharacterized protein n=1 Tax=Trifolium subterraneum TaxID=3900 RepID=A0A2Z6MMR0_TRISU|nr:hypothetical protein TSUD_323290 [Trifolium subterraneum]
MHRISTGMYQTHMMSDMVSSTTILENDFRERFKKQGTYSCFVSEEKAPYITKAKKERAVCETEKFMQSYNIGLAGDNGTAYFPISRTRKASRTRQVKQMLMLEMPSSPSTSSADECWWKIPSSPSTSSEDESLLSAEIRGVQSKPFGPQATATLMQSFDLGQVTYRMRIFRNTLFPTLMGEINMVPTTLCETPFQNVGPTLIFHNKGVNVRASAGKRKVLSAMEVNPLPTFDPVVSVADTLMADPQTSVSRSVDVVMKDQVPIPEDLLHQVKQECSCNTDNADPADDLLSLLTNSSPAASAWLDSSNFEAIELFKELKRLVSKPLDVTTVDTSAFDQMRRLVEELKPLKPKNAFLTATLPVYEQAANSKEDLVKKLLPLKEQKDEIAVNRKQKEAVMVKAKEKVDKLTKQLVLAEAELAEANTGITVFINLEKKRVDSINALRGEVNQTAAILWNLQSDYKLAVWTKKELEDMWLKITQSSSP